MKSNINYILSIMLLIGLVFSVITIVKATTPDPGHNFTEGSGGINQGDIVYGSGTDILSALPKVATSTTMYLSNGGLNNNPTWSLINLVNSVTGVLPVKNGGYGTTVSAITIPYLSTGTHTTTVISSATPFKIGLFNLPFSMTVNQLSYNVGKITTAGSYRLCIYDVSGIKRVDVVGVPVAGVNSVKVNSVLLEPGNYYIAMGCASNCNNTVSLFNTITNPLVDAITAPLGKIKYEGSVTMTSGFCSLNLPVITPAINSTPVVRLDN